VVNSTLKGSVNSTKWRSVAIPWLCGYALERILPPRRERPAHFALPELRSPADAAAAIAAIAAAVADGDLTPSEAGELAKLVDTYVRTPETSDFDRRLRAVEEKTSQIYLR